MKILALVPILFLVGCLSTKPEIVRVYVYEQPPDKLLNDCVIYKLKGDTVRDVVEQSLNNIGSLELCNQDKKSLRLWYKLNNDKKESHK